MFRAAVALSALLLSGEPVLAAKNPNGKKAKVTKSGKGPVVPPAEASPDVDWSEALFQPPGEKNKKGKTTGIVIPPSGGDNDGARMSFETLNQAKQRLVEKYADGSGASQMKAKLKAKIEQVAKEQVLKLIKTKLLNATTTTWEQALAYSRDQVKLYQKPSFLPPSGITVPPPIAAWDFNGDMRDRIGNLHGYTSVGNPIVTDGSLVLDGSSAVVTGNLASPLTEKTLEVRLKLDNLSQRGGGAMGVETVSSGTFDSITYAEQEQNKWMPGSDYWRRTASFGAPAEAIATDFIHLAYVYRADGTIVAYRNGVQLGNAVRKTTAPASFDSNSRVVFGARYNNIGFLKGAIDGARLYNYALSSAQVTAAFATPFSSTAVVEAGTCPTDPKLYYGLEETLASFAKSSETCHKCVSDNILYPLDIFNKVADGVNSVANFVLKVIDLFKKVKPLVSVIAKVAGFFPPAKPVAKVVDTVVKMLDKILTPMKAGLTSFKNVMDKVLQATTKVSDVLANGVLPVINMMVDFAAVSYTITDFAITCATQHDGCDNEKALGELAKVFDPIMTPALEVVEFCEKIICPLKLPDFGIFAKLAEVFKKISEFFEDIIEAFAAVAGGIWDAAKIATCCGIAPPVAQTAFDAISAVMNLATCWTDPLLTQLVNELGQAFGNLKVWDPIEITLFDYPFLDFEGFTFDPDTCELGTPRIGLLWEEYKIVIPGVTLFEFSPEPVPSLEESCLTPFRKLDSLSDCCCTAKDVVLKDGDFCLGFGLDDAVGQALWTSAIFPPYPNPGSAYTVALEIAIAATGLDRCTCCENKDTTSCGFQMGRCGTKAVTDALRKPEGASCTEGRGAHCQCVEGFCGHYGEASDSSNLQCCKTGQYESALVRDMCQNLREDNYPHLPGPVCYFNRQCLGGYCTSEGLGDQGYCKARGSVPNGASCSRWVHNAVCATGTICGHRGMASDASNLHCCVGQYSTTVSRWLCNNLPDGTLCYFSDQCLSGSWCTSNGIGGQGTCIKKKPMGADCSTPHPVNEACLPPPGETKGWCAHTGYASVSSNLRCCRGYYDSTVVRDLCQDLEEDSICYFSRQCRGGYCTSNGVGGTGYCKAKYSIANGYSCSKYVDNVVCQSGKCGHAGYGSDDSNLQCCRGYYSKTISRDLCQDLPAYTVCYFTDQCQYQHYCSSNGAGGSGYCYPMLERGAVCTNNYQCKTPKCGHWGEIGNLKCCDGYYSTTKSRDLCTGLPTGTACYFNDQCLSGHKCTSNGIGGLGVCKQLIATGSPCPSQSNSDCLSGMCNRCTRDGGYTCCRDTYYCYAFTSGDCKSGYYYCTGCLGH